MTYVLKTIKCVQFFPEAIAQDFCSLIGTERLEKERGIYGRPNHFFI